MSAKKTSELDAQLTAANLDSLRVLAETLTGKSFKGTTDPIKLQAIIDISRADNIEEAQAPLKGIDSLEVGIKKIKEEAMKLVRVHVTAMSPFEKQLKGNFFDAGNTHIGYAKRFIPFDTDWHVEQILVDLINTKRYRYKVESKDHDSGRMISENRFGKSFNVAILPSLTDKELTEHVRGMKAREYDAG